MTAKRDTMSNGPPQPTPHSTPLTEQPIEIERSLEYRTIYSNLFRYRLTPNDVSITFQLLTDRPGLPMLKLKVVEEAEVTMSHNQIKSFLLHLFKLMSALRRNLDL